KVDDVAAHDEVLESLQGLEHGFLRGWPSYGVAVRGATILVGPARRTAPGYGARLKVCRTPHVVGEIVSEAARMRAVKTFEELWSELAAKAAGNAPGSGTVDLLAKGVHAVGKKVVEEAAEAWMAAEHEGPDRAA